MELYFFDSSSRRAIMERIFDTGTDCSLRFPPEPASIRVETTFSCEPELGAGAAFSAGACTKDKTSFFVILPLGPVPVTLLKSSFSSRAIFLARGEAMMRSEEMGLADALPPSSPWTGLS